MKKFKIYGFIESKSILITNSESLSSAATFDETMKLEENMKSSF